MTTERISSARAGFVDDSKRRPCRWCGKMPEGQRRTFCSPECVHEHKLRTDPAYQARHVLARDHGVCESCGRDCVAEMAAIHEVRRVAAVSEVENGTAPYWCRASFLVERCGHEGCVEDAVHNREHAPTATHAVAEHCRALGMPPHLWSGRRRLWEMDHRVPVVEGGGDCGLDNLRTLCWACHRRATAELAARRARARKAAPRG